MKRRFSGKNSDGLVEKYFDSTIDQIKMIYNNLSALLNVPGETAAEKNAAIAAKEAAETAQAGSENARDKSETARDASQVAQGLSEDARNAAETAQEASETAQGLAEGARDTAISVLDSFDDRYLGAKIADPALDNDGDPLLAGALYFNSALGEMRVYSGAAWTAAYLPITEVLLVANDLSDLNDAPTALTNLGFTANAQTLIGSTYAQMRTNLSLVPGTDVQAYSAQLATMTGLSPANGNFIVGDGSQFTVESGATARSSLGLGSLATLNTISNTNWSGADLSVGNGGTGASTASGALDNLGFTANAKSLIGMTYSAMRSALGLVIGTTVQAWSAVLDNLASGSISTGMVASIVDDGTISGGTYTPDPTSGNARKIINGGAFDFAAPTVSGDYTMLVQVTNGGTPGAVTITGFDKVNGDSLTATTSDNFFFHIRKFNGLTAVTMEALQ